MLASLLSLLRLAQFRLRILFRVAFLLLAVATVAMALYVLREEKQQAFDNYQESFRKTREQIAAQLRHPTGQLALLNPHSSGAQVTPLRPLVLPFSGLDFDDPAKVQHAIEMAGCLVQYPNDGAVCVAVGSNPWAGGFIYVAGRFVSDDLQAHKRGADSLTSSHRVRVQVAARGENYRWIAPFESARSDAPQPGEAQRGRLTGFVELTKGADEEHDDYARARPVKDFRGWIWQSTACVKPSVQASSSQAGSAACERESFFSIRLPVAVLRDALFQKTRPVWPPTDLDSIQVRVEVLAPGSNNALLDSNSDEAHPPFLLTDLQPLLLPGEALRIRKLKADTKTGTDANVIQLVGAEASANDAWQIINWLIRRLPVDEHQFSMEAREEIATPAGPYELVLNGDVRSANKILARAATRVSWFVAAMLVAIFSTWLFIELSVIRRIAVLTRRTSSVMKTVRATGEGDPLDLSDLRGPDELGILASSLHDLLRRVREDVEREKIRAGQEKDMWHAVGHEIMSPLQSLMVLHGKAGDPAARYIHRMQQAVRVLYGQASPSEAFESTLLQVGAIDLNAFLIDVAANAEDAGISGVVYVEVGESLIARADDYSLEDVITHVLKNADRFRAAGSDISIRLEKSDTAAAITIHNRGPHIPDDLIDKIFEYGVSDQPESGAHGNRGQGLFVARTYMAKMSGTIIARNVEDGVEFILSLQRVA